MQPHSPRQLEMMRRMGIDVWRLRNAVEETAAEALVEPSVETAGQQSVRQDARQAVELPSAAKIDCGDDNLDAIVREVAACQRCPLHESRTHPVPGIGNASADWMFVGEAPGQNEDLQGEPFVGRAGQLLDRMIAALGMRREQVYIANVLKCRPPGNRDPLPEEVVQCEPFLHRQLKQIRPKVIVALGGVSAKALLRTDQPVGKMRGRVFEYGPDAIPLVVTYHPAYLLRSPGQKAKVWDDLWQARSLVMR